MRKPVLLLFSVILLDLWVLLLAPIELSFPYGKEEETAIHEPYEESGASLKLLGIDISDLLSVSGEVDTEHFGDYPLTYSWQFGFRHGQEVKTVSVKDLRGPRITSEEEIVLLYQNWDEEVKFPAFTAEDAIDGDVSDTVTIADYDHHYAGVHLLEVSASDKSGNLSRRVLPLVVYNSEDTALPLPEELKDGLKDGIYDMRIEEGRWILQGRQQSAELPQLYLKGEEDVLFAMTSLDQADPSYYEASLDLNALPEGTYVLQIRTEKESLASRLCYVLEAQRLGRRKIGEKLISWNYGEEIRVSAEPFAYEYDIVIDAGHGEDDRGATAVDGSFEREINLMVSQYEKKRYEEHGLKVWIDREDAEYVELQGEEDWERLMKVSHTLGWYGTVSRYAYSNHHNSDQAGYGRGPEILIAPSVTREEIPEAFRLYEEFPKIYPLITTRWRLTAKDYSTNAWLDRSEGQIYPGVRSWYANIRCPWEQYGIHVVTYEGCYLNNEEDFAWYITEGNWKKVSELKVRAYVEALGLEYIPVKGISLP